MVRRHCLAALAIVVAGPWLIAAAPDGAAREPCAGSPTEASMAACHARERAAADRDLNAAYRKLQANYRRDEPGLAAALVTAQRRWIAFRDAECVVATWDSRGGSAFGVYADACATRLTRARTATFRDMLAAP